MFDLQPKCPKPSIMKLSGIFGWRHTYRVHHHQKGLSHYNLHKTYSLNLPPKKHHETSVSNPSLPEASSATVNELCFRIMKCCFIPASCCYLLLLRDLETLNIPYSQAYRFSPISWIRVCSPKMACTVLDGVNDMLY